MSNLVKFEVGKTYSCRSACDHNCVWEFKVLGRTDKTVTLSDGKRRKLSVYDGVETCFPIGRYSMAPTLRADKFAAV